MPLAAVDPVGLCVFEAMAVGAAFGVASHIGLQVLNAAVHGQADFSFRSLVAAGAAGAVGGGVGYLAAGAGAVHTGTTSILGTRVGAGVTGAGVQAGLGGAAGGATGAAVRGENVLQGAVLGAGSGMVLNHDMGTPGDQAGAIGGAVGPQDFAYGTVGETVISASLGGHLGKWAGGAVGFGQLGGWMGAMNGTFTGARGVYNWSRPSGYASFAMDSTWGLLGTSLGNGVNLMNVGYPSSYSNELSHRQNRQVYLGGFPYSSRFAHTQGNTVTNLDRGRGAHRQELLDHETMHVWQSRIAGPIHQGSYVASFGFGLVVGSMYSAVNGANWWDSVFTVGYYNNPMEMMAYGENNPEARQDGAPEPFLLF